MSDQHITAHLAITPPPSRAKIAVSGYANHLDKQTILDMVGFALSRVQCECDR